MEDALSLATNGMVNLIAAKREALLRYSKLNDQEKKALRAVSPIDKDNRIFGGRLHEFMDSRQQRNLASGLQEMSRVIKQHKRPSQDDYSGSGKRNKQTSDGRPQSGYSYRGDRSPKQGVRRGGRGRGNFRGDRRKDQSHYRDNKDKSEHKF